MMAVRSGSDSASVAIPQAKSCAEIDRNFSVAACFAVPYVAQQQLADWMLTAEAKTFSDSVTALVTQRVTPRRRPQTS